MDGPKDRAQSAPVQSVRTIFTDAARLAGRVANLDDRFSQGAGGKQGAKDGVSWKLRVFFAALQCWEDVVGGNSVFVRMHTSTMAQAYVN